MATINFARREIEAKIVYVGPALSGKTTNVQVLHRLVPRAQRGDLHQLSTDGDRTLFFDFIPVELGQIAGFTAHFKLFTVPGQVYYQQTRKAVLQGADGVVFVADSSAGRAQANLDAMIDLEQNLRAHGLDLASIPLVVQLNKRDVEDALPVNHMITELNPFGVPTVESIAASGYGVLDTLYKVTEIATKRIRENLSGQKNAVKLQAVQKDDRESESSVVDEHLSRIHKVRPEEEAAAERMKAAGRLRPDDVDSFLLEFVDRDEDLFLDDALPPPPADLAEPAPAEPTPPRFEDPGAPPTFAEAQPSSPAAGKKAARKGDKRATARPAAPPERRPTAPAAPPPLSPDAGTEADAFVAPPSLAEPTSEPTRPEPEPASPSLSTAATLPPGSLSTAATLPPVSQANAPTLPPPPAGDEPRAEPPARPRAVSLPPTPVLPDPRPAETRAAPRRSYPEGPPIDARVDARLLSGVLLREVLGSTVGADGRATIEIVLERDGAARRHPLRFVESQPETPWGSISVAAIGALVLGFLGGLLVGWQFL